MNSSQVSRACFTTAAMLLVAIAGAASARDPGINQPGAAGNPRGDPGINQPGAAGNVGVGAPGRGAAPGVGAPGVGAPGRGAAPGPGVGAPGIGAADPGRNQPGTAGNVAGVARTSVRR